MTFHRLPTNRDLLKHNRNLPAWFRQSIVRLNFGEHIPLYRKDEFLRIRLTRMQLNSGEDEFYIPHLMQRHRTGTKPCRMCWQPMTSVTASQQVCRTRGCRNYGRIQEVGPLRGVVKVGTRIRNANGDVLLNLRLPDGMIEGCLLILDRRYSEQVLAEVYRTAGWICDEQGWRLL